jgi:hypothetical protein
MVASMKRLALLLLLALLCGGQASAQEIGGEGAPLASPAKLDEILLKDGSLLLGRIIEESADLVVIETASLGRLEIPRANIERLARRDAPAGIFPDPDQNTIMFCPTPATLPKGDAYFRDFELFLLNVGFGVTDALDLSFGTLFPVSSDVFMLSVGAKFRLVDRDSTGIGLALTGSYTVLEETQFGAFGGVAGIGNRRNSLNLSVNYTYDDAGETEMVYIVGGDAQMGRRNKIFAEYFSSSSLLEDEEDDLSGFINIGFRFFGERHSFSLSGFRPLGEDTGSLVAFPMIMYSQHF